MKSKSYSVLVIAICLIFIFLTLLSFPKENKYNEKYIINKDISSIVEIYGEFDRIFFDESGKNIVSAWYTINERKPFKIGNLVTFGMRNERYQVICFENDIAVKTFVRVGNIGG